MPAVVSDRVWGWLRAEMAAVDCESKGLFLLCCDELISCWRSHLTFVIKVVTCRRHKHWFIKKWMRFNDTPPFPWRAWCRILPGKGMINTKVSCNEQVTLLLLVKRLFISSSHANMQSTSEPRRGKDEQKQDLKNGGISSPSSAGMKQKGPGC